MRRLFALVALTCSSAAPIAAWCDTTTAGWSTEYGFASPAEREMRLERAHKQALVDGGYYDSFGPSITTNIITYDDSVGDISVTASEDSDVTVSTQTDDGSGTASYSVGSINTTDVVIDGIGNTIDVSSSADSTGCQDASITTTSASVVGTDGTSIGTSSFSSLIDGASGICP